MTHEEQEVKLWLEEYREIRQRIKIMKEMAKQRRSDPILSSHDGTESGFGLEVFKQSRGSKRETRAQAETRYDAEVRTLIQELENREILVGKLRGEAFLLFARYYLMGEHVTWERLAEDQGCSVRHIHDVRARGLQKLAAIYSREKACTASRLPA